MSEGVTAGNEVLKSMNKIVKEEQERNEKSTQYLHVIVVSKADKKDIELAVL